MYRNKLIIRITPSLNTKVTFLTKSQLMRLEIQSPQLAGDVSQRADWTMVVYWQLLGKYIE